MYWYLSFLRAPPVSLVLATTGAPNITITPQVANDLRTEIKETPTSIDYIWQRTHPSVQPPLPPVKLTIYHPPASTYKQLSINLPSRSKPGEKWRLGLVQSSATHLTELESLARDEVGVLSVWSEPVALLKAAGAKPTSAKNAAGGKQGRITRNWTLPDGERELTVVEQTSFDLDKKLWDSGLAMSALLATWLFPRSTHSTVMKTDAKWTQAILQRMLPTTDTPLRRLVELGTGTGILSIALAALLQQYIASKKVPNATDEEGQEDKVVDNVPSISLICTDLPSAIPLIEENLTLNAALWTATEDVSIDVEPLVLDWDEPLPAIVLSDRIDLVIAADVTYNTSAFPSLLKTLTSLLQPGSDSLVPLLVLAYKERDPAERDLWDMLKNEGVKMEKIGEVKGADAGTGETEIWVGSMDANAV